MPATRSAKKSRTAITAPSRVLGAPRVFKAPSPSHIRLRSVNRTEDSKDFNKNETTSPMQPHPALYISIPPVASTFTPRTPQAFRPSSLPNGDSTTSVHMVNNTQPDEGIQLAAIHALIPQVYERLQTVETMLRTEREAHAKEVARLGQRIEELETSLDAFHNGTFTLTFAPRSTSSTLPQQDSNPAVSHDREEPSSSISTIQPNPSISILSLPPAPPLDHHPRPRSFPQTKTNGPPHTLSIPDAAEKEQVQITVKGERIPQYKLSRITHTIPELWHEWTVGLSGQPSVEELNRRRGTRWRRSDKEAKFYSVRKMIIEELRRRAEAKGGFKANIEGAVMEMELERKVLGTSLNGMYKILTERRKKGLI